MSLPSVSLVANRPSRWLWFTSAEGQCRPRCLSVKQDCEATEAARDPPPRPPQGPSPVSTQGPSCLARGACVGAEPPRVFLSCPVLAAKRQRLRKSCPHPKSGKQRSVSSLTGWQRGETALASRLPAATDGPWIFHVLLRIYVDKKEKKKKTQGRKDFLEAGRCLLCFTRCLKGTRSHGGPEPSHRPRGTNSRSLASCKSKRD